MEKFALDGLWLMAALAVVYFVGVFTAQYVKDKIAGVPAELRAALRVAESDAKSQLNAAKAKAVADMTGLFKQATAKVDEVVTAAKPVADAPTAVSAALGAPAAPAAPPVPPVPPVPSVTA